MGKRRKSREFIDFCAKAKQRRERLEKEKMKAIAPVPIEPIQGTGWDNEICSIPNFDSRIGDIIEAFHQVKDRMGQFVPFPTHAITSDGTFSFSAESFRRHSKRDCVDTGSLRESSIAVNFSPGHMIISTVEQECLGDRTCVNNAMSPKLQCAINPEGKCSECPDYERRK